MIRQVRARHRFAQRGRLGPVAPLLLLLGTPGTGKRPVGSYLAAEHGFTHFDFENAETRESFLGSTDAELGEELAALSSAGRGLVITWGAGPVTQLRHVRRLRLLGIEPVWFDSDRGTACRAHFADAPRAPRIRFVDPFERDGSFRPLEEIIEELLHPRPQPRPGVAPVPEPARESSPSGALWSGSLWAKAAGGLALAAGTAFATVALLSGVGSGASGPQLAVAGDTAVKHVAKLPDQGVLVSGSSLAGIHLGDSMATVRALWGGHFTSCPGHTTTGMWCYLYPPPDDPVGAGVQFAGGKVVAVFTLGMTFGWRTTTGIKVGQMLDNPGGALSDGSKWLRCAGYSAKATPNGNGAVTSILTLGPSVYGFALTRPSVSPCH